MWFLFLLLLLGVCRVKKVMEVDLLQRKLADFTDALIREVGSFCWVFVLFQKRASFFSGFNDVYFG